MVTPKIKRSKFKTFINTTPLAVATYELLGDGVTEAAIEYNPQVTTEQYIHEDSGTTSIDSYAPNMPVDASCKLGDPVFEYVDELRKARAVQADAQTDVVNVWLYEDSIDLYDEVFPAEKQAVSISINNFGGAANVANKINFTINYIGDPIVGTFDITDNTFTAS